MKVNLNRTQASYLIALKQELKNLEQLGKGNSNKWWSIAESIDAIEQNL